jgi:hypothetical protein
MGAFSAQSGHEGAAQICGAPRSGHYIDKLSDQTRLSQRKLTCCARYGPWQHSLVLRVVMTRMCVAHFQPCGDHSQPCSADLCRICRRCFDLGWRCIAAWPEFIRRRR